MAQRVGPFSAVVYLVAVSASSSTGLGAQTRKPVHQFEVASVRANTSGASSGSSRLQPGGRFVATNESLEELILRAYRLQPHQLVGAPDWIARENFDINAKAADGVELVPSYEPGPIEYMLQSLLADRFGLVVHTETHELPVYALVMARADKRLGPQLQPSAVDCNAIAAAVMRGGAPLPAPVKGRPVCGGQRSAGRISGGALPLSQLAEMLSNQGRPVVDRTGLTGVFDFDLTYTPPPQSTAGAAPAANPGGPDVFTALQEQLGLKLEAQRAPVEVLVIDRVERPLPD